MRKKRILTILMIVSIFVLNPTTSLAGDFEFKNDDLKLEYIHPEDFEDENDYQVALKKEKEIVSVMCLVLSLMNGYTAAAQIPLQGMQIINTGVSGLMTYEQLREFTEWFVETDLRDPEYFKNAVEMGYRVSQGTFNQDVLISSEINKNIIQKLNLRIGQRSEMTRTNLQSKQDTVLFANERFIVFWEPEYTLPALADYILGFDETKEVNENYDFTGQIIENKYYKDAIESVRSGSDGGQYGTIWNDYAFSANYFSHTDSRLNIDEIEDEESWAYIGKARRIEYDICVELDPQNTNTYYDNIIYENYPDGMLDIYISVYDNQSGTYQYRRERLPARITETGWTGITDEKNFLLRFNIDIGGYYYETRDFVDNPNKLNWLLFYVAESSYGNGDYACANGGNLYDPSESSCALHKYTWAQIRQQSQPDESFVKLSAEEMMNLETCWNYGNNGQFISYGFVPAGMLIEKEIISDSVVQDITPGNLPTIQVNALEQQQQPTHEDNLPDAEEEETELKQINIAWDEIFPFCLPWDFLNFLKILDVPAEAPKWQYDVLAVPAFFGVDETYVNYRLDLSDYENEMKVFRSIELYTFAVSMVFMSGKLIWF